MTYFDATREIREQISEIDMNYRYATHSTGEIANFQFPYDEERMASELGRFIQRIK